MVTQGSRRVAFRTREAALSARQPDPDKLGLMKAPALVGRTIAGRFTITGFLREGAMAAVYRGVQDGEPRELAIKVMLPQLLSDPTFVGRFRREAKAAARLNHPNTVRILDYGVDGRLLY